MQLLNLLAAAGLLLCQVVAVPTVPQFGPDGMVNVGGDGNNTLLERAFSEDEIHEAILENVPAEDVITEDKLHEYIAEHQGKDILVYLKDARAMVSLPAANSTALARRQDCEYYRRWKTTGKHDYYDPWLPASICFWNTKGSGGSFELAYEYSRATSYSTALEFTIVKDLFKINFGSVITDTYSEKESYRCKVDKGSVGQVWQRHHVGFIATREEECGTCSGICWDVDDAARGWGVAPYAKNSPNFRQLGCSTGTNNVWCEPY